MGSHLLDMKLLKTAKCLLDVSTTDSSLSGRLWEQRHYRFVGREVGNELSPFGL